MSHDPTTVTKTSICHPKVVSSLPNECNRYDQHSDLYGQVLTNVVDAILKKKKRMVVAVGLGENECV